jgi:ATP-dependent Clp protease ATP-binding subunit ClpB
MRDKVMETVRHQFKPEFLNRVDEIIVFHRLGQEELVRIIDLQLERVEERLADRDIDLLVDEGARRYLAEKGFDPAYGARPLKRLIQREIENELALRLLDGTFRSGEKIEVGVSGDGLTFSNATAAATA